MNYLAHLYLSGRDCSRRVGNFMGDYVKGRQWVNFPDTVAEGILIHRFIDDYSDNHPLFKASKAYFTPSYRLYSGVVTDMIFDHYLAKNWNLYSAISLEEYMEEFYKSLTPHLHLLPTKLSDMIPKLTKSKRIQRYESKEGILEAIDLMSRYTSLPDAGKDLDIILYEHGDKIEHNFLDFFDQISQAVEAKFDYIIVKK